MHPITLFTLVSLLSCITFSLFRLCLRKRPDKSMSYQVSSSATTPSDHAHLKKHEYSVNKIYFLLFQMSDQPAEGTFTDADRSTVTSTTASNVQ